MINISKPKLRFIPEIKKIIDSCKLSNGEYVKKFEEDFSKYCGTKHAIAVNSGTAALHSALSSLKLENKKVAVPAMTFIASTNAIIMAGLKPVLVDINEDDYCINVDKIPKDVGAILAVSLYGHIYNHNELIKKFKVPIIEDASHSAGARAGVKSGNVGDISCFSLYATKNLQAGEGGIVTTNNDSYADFIRKFRQHGTSDGMNYEMLGHNYKMHEITAALANDQLKILDKLIKKRRENAEYYNRMLKNSGLILPKERNGFYHGYHQYVVLVEKDKYGITRDELNKYLNDNGIQSRIHYPTPINKIMHMRPFALGNFPVAERVANTCLSLPVHPYLRKEDLKYIVKEVLI